MLLIPAIDSREGRCIRLKQGLMEQAAVFSDSPTETALRWLKQGTRRLHLVDLNGAFVGIPKNFPAIKSILTEVANDIPVQLSGGIRDLATIEKYLDLGLTDIIISTAAVKNPDFVREACKKFPGQIIAGLDAKDGMVAIDGQAAVAERRVADLAKRFEENGINAIIYIDIDRDGIVSGIDIEATVRLAQAAAVPVIASGSLINLDDVRASYAVKKYSVAGAITSHAIYEGSIDFTEAQKLTGALSAA